MASSPGRATRADGFVQKSVRTRQILRRCVSHGYLTRKNRPYATGRYVHEAGGSIVSRSAWRACRHELESRILKMRRSNA